MKSIRIKNTALPTCGKIPIYLKANISQCETDGKKYVSKDIKFCEI